MITKVAKWGNSLGVRFPKKLMDQAGIKDGTAVELVLEKGRLVVTPVKKKVTLAELVAQITPENRHEEVDFGKPQGREIW